VGCAQRQARLCDPLSPCHSHGPGDPEVGHHRLAFLQQDVLGLDVAVDHALAVRVVQGTGHLAREFDGLFN
jgi:hypothetical protein